MPMYDFVCNACESRFEAITKYGELATCTCGSADTKRLMSAPAIFTTIVATTRTSKKYKAGYSHKFQNRPAEKISVPVAAPVTKKNP